MFERFTEKAIKVIMLAQEESRRLGHNFVGTEQILLGLIGEGTGSAARLLKSHGVTLKAARNEVEKIIGRGTGFVAVEIPFTPRAKRVLELSWKSSKDLGLNYICTEHLLMGLVAEREGVAVQVLEVLGFDFSKIQPNVLIYFTLEEDSTPSFIKELSNWVGRLKIPKKPMELSTPAAELLENAKQIVRESGRMYVGTDQVLLALLQENNNPVSEAIAARGVTTTTVKAKVAALCSGLPKTDSAELTLTPLLQRIIVDAGKVARGYRRELIEIEDLITAMLVEPKGAAMYILERLGVAGQFGLIEDGTENRGYRRRKRRREGRGRRRKGRNSRRNK